MGKIIKRVSLIWWRYLVVGAFFGLIGYNISVPIINNIIDNNETAKFYGQLISVVLLGLNYVINNKLNVVRAVVQFWIIISVSFTLINLFDFTANLQNLFSILLFSPVISAVVAPKIL